MAPLSQFRLHTKWTKATTLLLDSFYEVLMRRYRSPAAFPGWIPARKGPSVSFFAFSATKHPSKLLLLTLEKSGCGFESASKNRSNNRPGPSPRDQRAGNEFKDRCLSDRVLFHSRFFLASFGNLFHYILERRGSKLNVPKYN